MKKSIIICDWILYICAAIVLSYIVSFTMMYIGTQIGENRQPNIRVVMIFAYALWRVKIAPIFLVAFVSGRLLDRKIRMTPLFINKYISENDIK